MGTVREKESSRSQNEGHQPHKRHTSRRDRSGCAADVVPVSDRIHITVRASAKKDKLFHLHELPCLQPVEIRSAGQPITRDDDLMVSPLLLFVHELSNEVRSGWLAWLVLHGGRPGPGCLRGRGGLQTFLVGRQVHGYPKPEVVVPDARTVTFYPEDFRGWWACRSIPQLNSVVEV